MIYCGKVEFGQILRSFSLNSGAIRLKRPKNLTQIDFLSLRSVKSDGLLARLLICSMLVAAAGCSVPKISIPRVHKITIQQGNVITQQMIDKLKPGMTRTQVAFVMGEPVSRNTFDDSRWDYIYTVDVPGVFQDKKRMSLYFENDLLAYFTGDYVPTGAGSESEPQDTAATK